MSSDASTSELTTPQRSRWRLRPLSFIVLLGVGALAVASCLVTRQIVHDQEHRLLKQRTDEAGLYLSSIIGGVASQLSTVATTAAVQHESPTAFVAANTAFTKLPQGFKSLSLIRTTPAPSVVATAGRPLGAGESEALATAGRLAAKNSLTGATVATPLYDGVGGARRLGFAYSSPALRGYVVYAESDVFPQRPTPVTAGAPFSELVAAVYAVPHIQADQLVVQSAGAGALPLRGQTASVTSPIGQGGSWLLVAKARHPLVGSVATWTPWALLGVGLLAGLLATGVVEALARRRDYADEVAEVRTRELKQSLEELATAHDQLVRQERLAAIGELASTIGHELRNPLGVISNAHFLLRTDLGKLGAEPGSVSDRHLSTAEREVSAATVIVSDLLEFARQRDPVMSDFDAAALVDEVLTVLPPPRGIAVERVGATTPTPAVADRDMLRQVLLNLLGNAYQALLDGGTVRIGVEAAPTGVQFRVEDTGSGMPADVRERLFQPFFTTKARGVGLGLAVTKRIVESHGGTIDVRSEPGQGAAFVVALPQAPIQLPRQTVRTDAGSPVTAGDSA